MKRKFFCIGILAMIFSKYITSQSLSPQVYSSAGGHYTAGTSQLTTTIGEPLTTTYAGATVIVTQGFNQPETGNAGVSETEDFVFNAYPNPAQNTIMVSTNKDLAEFYLELIDQLGQVIYTHQFVGNAGQVDISSLASGNYHLRIGYLKNKFNSFSIIKTTNQ